MTPIETFLASKACFHCTKMKATIALEACIERQQAEPEITTNGHKYTKRNTIVDEYCRSGECLQGKLIAKQVRETRLRNSLKAKLGGF